MAQQPAKQNAHPAIEVGLRFIAPAPADGDHPLIFGDLSLYHRNVRLRRVHRSAVAARLALPPALPVRLELERPQAAARSVTAGTRADLGQSPGPGPLTLKVAIRK
jgi:hypothetical protein